MQKPTPGAPIYILGKVFDSEQKIFEGLLSIRGVGHRLATYLVHRSLGLSKASNFAEADTEHLTSLLENLPAHAPSFLLNQRSCLQYRHDLEKELDVRNFGCKVWHRRNRTYKGLCIAVGRKTRGQRSNRRRNRKKAGSK